MGKDVHPRGIKPAEKRLARLVLPIHEIQGGGEEFLVYGFHALRGQRPGILSLAIRGCLEDAAWAEPLFEFGVLRVIRILRLLLRIEVIEIAEEFIEAVV